MSDYDTLVTYVIECLGSYGICVLDDFLGEILAKEVKTEVINIVNVQPFIEGQVLSATNSIRGDKITWVDGTEPYCYFIRSYIHKIDNLVYECMERLGQQLAGRSQAMISIYPKNGTKYLKHVDNPYKDGRLVTTIYYLNEAWNRERDGGCLKLYPTMIEAEPIVEPLFDRVILFWSDVRNPHEVEPCFRTRFAITVWYMDQKELEASMEPPKYKIIPRTISET